MRKTKKNKLLIYALSTAFVCALGFATASIVATPAFAATNAAMTLQGGQIRTDLGTTGIRFKTTVTDDLYQSLTDPTKATYDATAMFGTVIAPLDYFDGIEAGDDYMVELAAKNFAVAPIVHYSQPYQLTAVAGQAQDTNWYINGSISNILYENSNREFFGIGFIRTGEEGNYTYTYPEIDSIDGMSRTVTEIAILARESNYTTDTDELVVIDGFIKRGINQANGADENAAPTVNVDLANARKTYLVGESFDLSASYTPSILSLTVTYTSSDPTVAKITGNEVEILKAGTAEITASVVNYDGVFTVTTDVLEITAGTLEFTTPKYMAVGKAENLSVTFNGTAVTDGVAYDVDSSVLTEVNGKVTPVKAGETMITATVSTEGVSVPLTQTVTVLDFGNTTGEMADFATNLNAWNYRNYNNAEGVTLTYTATKVADARPIANYGLHYYRPDNTGTSWGATGKMVYLHPEIVDLAKAVGYKYLTYFILVPKMTDINTSCSSVSYVVNENGSMYTYGEDNNQSISFNWNSATTNWTRSYIDLSKIPDGKGVGFIGYGQNIYLTNVQFIGSKGSAIDTAWLDQKEINTSNGLQTKTVDLAQEELLGKLFVTDMSNATLSIEKGAYTAGGLDAVVIKRDAGTYNYSNTNKLNGLVISSEWIQAAKAKGCTCFVFRYYNANGGLSVYKVKDNDTAISTNGSNSYLASVANATTTWGFYGIKLETFKPGERIVFSFAGDTLKLANIEFRTTLYASSLAPAN